MDSLEPRVRYARCEVLINESPLEARLVILPAYKPAIVLGDLSYSNDGVLQHAIYTHLTDCTRAFSPTITRVLEASCPRRDSAPAICGNFRGEECQDTGLECGLFGAYLATRESHRTVCQPQIVRSIAATILTPSQLKCV